MADLFIKHFEFRGERLSVTIVSDYESRPGTVRFRAHLRGKDTDLTFFMYIDENARWRTHEKIKIDWELLRGLGEMIESHCM